MDVGPNLEDDIEADLGEKAEKIVEDEIVDTERFTERSSRKASREAVRRDGKSKTGAATTPQEMEFLVRQRTRMDNEELEKFLSGTHEVNESRNWSPFSRTEEKYLLQNVKNSSVEDLSESVDRSPEEVRMQLRIMGLEDQIR